MGAGNLIAKIIIFFPDPTHFDDFPIFFQTVSLPRDKLSTIIFVGHRANTSTVRRALLRKKPIYLFHYTPSEDAGWGETSLNSSYSRRFPFRVNKFEINPYRVPEKGREL